MGLFVYSALGHRTWQIPLFLLGATIGVIGGNVLAAFSGFETGMIGNVSLPAAIGGGLLLLGICWFFTSPLPNSAGRENLASRDVVRDRDRSPV